MSKLFTSPFFIPGLFASLSILSAISYNYTNINAFYVFSATWMSLAVLFIPIMIYLKRNK